MREIFSFPKDLFSRRVLYGALFLHVIAAYFSAGYFHYPEHEILEWASAKLGLAHADSLAADYLLRARSWLQPGMVFGVSKLLIAADWFNPFVVAGFFRILSALLGFLVLLGLVNASAFWFPDDRVRKVTVFSAAFAWFIPYLHARYSGENWAGIFFFLGLIVLAHVLTWQRLGRAIKREMWFGLFVGCCWGLAFQFCFLALLLILPALAWWLRYSGRNWKFLALLVLGLASTLGLGAVVDNWGYSQWVFPAWNHFYLILPVSGDWSVGQMTSYFSYCFMLLPPLSSFLVLGTLFCWNSARRFSFTWVTLFYLAVLSFLPYKQLQLLFPIAPVTPVLLGMALQKNALLNRLLHRSEYLWTTRIIILINFVCMLPLILFPAASELSLYRKIWNENPEKLYLSGIDPYYSHGTQSTFYRRQMMQILPVVEFKQPEGTVLCGFPTECVEITEKYQCDDLGGNLPGWIETKVAPTVGEHARIANWHLLRCAKAKPPL